LEKHFAKSLTIDHDILIQCIRNKTGYEKRENSGKQKRAETDQGSGHAAEEAENGANHDKQKKQTKQNNRCYHVCTS
jgi:hypothetical protein